MNSASQPPRARTAYGIDRGPRSLLVTRAARTRRGARTDVVVDEQGAVPVRLPEKVQAEMDAATRRARALRCAALPVTACFTRRLRAPFASRAKAVKVFPALLDIQLPFPLEQCVYTFLDTARAGATGQVETLAVAARREDIAARLTQLREAGCDPEVLDHEGLALWRQSIEEIPVETDTLRVVAHLGEAHAAFLIGKGPRLEAVHAARVGADALRADIEAPDTPHPAPRTFLRRARQILHTLHAREAETPVQWLWTGPGIDDPNLTRRLEAELDDPLVQYLRHDNPRSFLARALATAGVAARPLPCNFRQGELAHPLVLRRERRHKRASAAWPLAAGLLLLAANLAWQRLIDHRNTALQHDISALAAELAGMPNVPRGQELEVVRRTLKERAASSAPFLRAFQPSLTAPLDAVIKAANAHQLEIDALTLRDDFAAVRGTAADWDQAKSLEQLLRSEGFAVKSNLAEAAADERIRYEIQGRRTP